MSATIRYLGFWVIVIIVQVLGKYMIIRYLDPQGYRGLYRNILEPGIKLRKYMKYVVRVSGPFFHLLLRSKYRV